MLNLLTLMQLTFLEMRRRRIVLAALACGAGCLVVFATAIYLLHHFPPPARTMSLLQSRTSAAADACPPVRGQSHDRNGRRHASRGCDFRGDRLRCHAALASKPVWRAEIVLAKWLVYWLAIAAYTAIMVLGIVLETLITGFSQPHVLAAVGLMTLQGTVLLSVVFAGAARLTTVANGMIAFGFYSVAVVGGWIEQIGVMMGDSGARYAGTVMSLLSPTDALWRRRSMCFSHP